MQIKGHKRSHAKKLQEQVNSFLTDFNSNTSENVILPKYSILVVLRNIHEEEEELDHNDRTNIVKNGPAKSERYSEKQASKSGSLQ